MTRKLHVVVGGQYGSEAKGAVTAWLGQLSGEPLAIRIGGPNAGHTAYDSSGRRWALRQVPAVIVANPNATVAIAAGSEIDPDVLRDEVLALEQAGIKVSRQLLIDSEATIITGDHKTREASLVKGIGSTGKGIGAARADRIMRTAQTWKTWLRDASATDRELFGDPVDVAMAARSWFDDVLIEGVQGYALGLHAGLYPHVTSTDCRAIDFLSAAGINPWQRSNTGGLIFDLQVWVVARMFPIRVAGTSGPLPGETSWDALGLPEERTTVTQKIRRVGEWDLDLVLRAIEANGGGGVNVALSMIDQVWPHLTGIDGVMSTFAERDDQPLPGFQALAGLPPELSERIKDVEQTGAKVRYLGTGPISRIVLGEPTR